MRDQQSVGRWKKPVQWMVLGVLFVLALSLLLSLFVQIPFVQNWIVNQISNKISRDLETEVKVGRFYLNFFDDVTVTDLLVRDQSGDTLLYSGKTYLDIHQPLRIISHNRLSFEEIDMRDLICYLERDATGVSNFKFLTDYLSQPQAQDKHLDGDSKLQIEFRSTLVGLRNMMYSQIDSSTGKSFRVSLPEGASSIDQRFGDWKMHIDFVSLISPQITLSSFHPSISTDQAATNAQPPPQAQDSSDQATTAIELRKLIITSGVFYADDIRKPKNFNPNVIKFTDFTGYDLNLIAEDIEYLDGYGSLTLSNLTLKTDEGFQIDQLRSDNVEFDPTHISLKDMALETPNSSLANEIELRFRSITDFDNFADKVILNIDLRDSYIALRDILYFAEKLNDNEFFILNGGHRIDLEGRINGRINNFRCRDFSLNIADKAKLAGNLSLKNVMVKGEELLNLDLTGADFQLRTLRQLIPNFNLPANFDRLGHVHFEGRFDGFFQDFVAYGNATTDLGAMRTDMRLDVNNTIDDARYSGNIELIDFDLNGWTGSDLFGNTSFNASVTNGIGLTPENASADLYADLDYFFFKDYLYQNAELNAVLNKSLFDGNLKIDDENVALDFSGTLDFSDSIPSFDFIANIDHIDFAELNFTERDLSASGNIDFNFDYYDLFNLDGTATGSNLRIQREGSTYAIDTLELFSVAKDRSNKAIELKSNIISTDLKGIFDLEKIPDTFYKLIQEKHPQFANRFGLYKDIHDSLVVDNNFTFSIEIENSQGIQKIFDPSLPDLIDLDLKGYFQNNGNNSFSYDIKMQTPLLVDGDKSIENLKIDLATTKDASAWLIGADLIQLGNKQIKPFNLQGALVSDSLVFQITSDEFSNVFTDIDFNGLLYLNEDLYQVDLKNSSFRLLDEPWQIIPDNQVQIGKKFIKTQNLVFLSDDSYLRVVSPGDESLRIETENVDISFLNDFLNFFDMKFSGNAYATLFFRNIFRKDNVDLNLVIDSLHINEDDFGTLRSLVFLEDLDSKGTLDFSMAHAMHSITAKGDFFVPLTKEQKGEQLEFFFDINLREFPIKVGEYFIGNAISNTEGTINGDVVIQSVNGRPGINGSIVMDGSTTIDYLGTTYTMVDEEVKINSTLFDFTGATLIDDRGNAATMSRGITHDFFKRFGLDATIASDYFQFLNTNKSENTLYYGTGIGSANVNFSGNFRQTDIRVEATTGEGTQLFIPVNNDYTTSGEDFIKFVIDQDTSDQQAVGTVDLRGIDMNMQLTITPEAEIQIIFDEFSGDIIKGTGNGDIAMTIQRDGTFQMTGKYVIEEGQYLYTFLDFINKPFIIERGGLITWSGDPLNADLNIEAKYTGLRTPPKNFIAEYVEGGTSTSVAQLAELATQVDVVLQLRGVLNQPQIDFNILFPDIDPALKNLTDSKMRLLKDDVSELNRQVYGLLIFNTFLPPTISVDLTATTVNTLSEFITSQLSNYVASYLSQAVEEVNYISGVDFYFDYNYYRSEDFVQGQQTGVKTGSEFAFAPNIRFFNDRVAFSPGASIIDGTVLQGSAFIGTDVKLEFFVTPDRRLKLSLFYKTFPSLEGRRNKLGLGFRFYNSYDQFSDIFSNKKQKTEQPATKEPSTTDNGKGN